MSLFRKLGVVFVTLGFVAGSMLTLFSPTVAALGPDIGPWQTSSSTLPAALTMSASATNNDFVYILGGTPDYTSISSSVYYAHLNTDGSVGSWQTSNNSLPVGLDALGAVAYNGYLYAFGGLSTSGSTNSVYYAHLNADGSLGTWQTSSNSLPETRFGAGVTLNNGHVYIVGGSDQNGNPTNSVYYAHLNTDGSVGSWQTSNNSLPGNSTGGMAVSYNGYIYQMGGFPNSYNNDYTDAVYYAHLSTDGSIDSWQTSSNVLPMRTSSAASLTSGGYLYVIGGARGVHGDSDFMLSSEVNYAHLNADGSIDSWQTSANNIPDSLVLMSLAVSSSDHVYLIGGQKGEGATEFSDSIYSTSLPVFDTTPPTITATKNPVANAASWNNTSVTVTFNCADEAQGSGLASCTPPVTLSAEGQNQTVTGTAVDNAGNTSTTTATVNIDKTAPVASSPTLSTSLVLFSANMTMNANATDALSGVAGGEFYIDTDPGQGQGTPMTYSNGKITASKTISNVGLGQHKVYMRTKDKAGNWSAPVYAQFTYIGF